MSGQFVTKKLGLVFFLVGFFMLFIGLLAFLPHQQVQALESHPQEFTDDCSKCHSQAVDLLAESAHADVPLTCDNCHKLVPGEEGADHPVLFYSTESEESTCGTCHLDIYTQWTESQHGSLSMTCASCHESHSLKQKLTEDNKLICENCHKEQVAAGHDSTHAAAGATCATCHIGNETGHTFGATLATCSSCHEDLHEANQLVVNGIEIESIPAEGAEEAASTEESAEAEDTTVPANEAEESASEPARGGVNLPAWLLLFAGLIVGGGVVWVVIGKDPGTPTDDEN